MSAEPNSVGPQLCKASCGFFGSERTEGYCSKCYRDELKKRNQNPTSSLSTPSSAAATTTTSSMPIVSSTTSGLPSAASSTSTSTPAPIQVTFTNAVSSKPIAIPSASSITSSISSPALGGLSPAVSASHSLSASPLSSSPLSSSPLSASPSKSRKRCSVCKKKLTLDYFSCKCSDDIILCAQHRLPHAHGCTYDHRKDQQSKIEKQNPVVKHDKLETI